jgi:hypothetical protein
MAAQLTAWQRNLVGPFRLLGRLKGEVFSELPGVRIGDGLGKVFSAFRRFNGRRAVVVVPQVASPAAWTVRVHSGVSPVPFLALEVEQAPQGADPVSVLADGLDAVTCVLEDLELREDAARHLVERPVRPRWARRARRLAEAAAAGGLLAACAVAGVSWWPRSQAPAGDDVPQVLTASIAETAHQPWVVVDEVPGAISRRQVLGIDLPKTPRKGQARADKAGRCERFEVAIYGLCWVKLDGKAPCGPTAYEYDGGCYRPAMLEGTSRTTPSGPPGPLTAAE